MDIDSNFPKIRVTIDTNIPDPSSKKKVAKKKGKTHASVIVGESDEPMTVVGKQITQEGLGFYARVHENLQTLKRIEKYLKKILYQAGADGIPVRPGIRSLKVWASVKASISYKDVAEKLFDALHTVLDAGPDSILADAALEEIGMLDKDGALVDQKKFFGKHAKKNPQENIKISVSK